MIRSFVLKQFLPEWIPSKIFTTLDTFRSYILILQYSPMQASRFASVGQTSMQNIAAIGWSLIKYENKQIRINLLRRNTTSSYFLLTKLTKAISINIRKLLFSVNVMLIKWCNLKKPFLSLINKRIHIIYEDSHPLTGF